MDETPNRKKCPNCGTMNFLSSETCLQCGTVLPVIENQPQEQQLPNVTMSPASPPSAYPPPYKSGDASTFVILGFIFAGIGLFCCGIFSVAGLVMGIIAQSKGDKLGIWVIVASSVSLLIQIAIIIFSFSMGWNGAAHGVNPLMPMQPHMPIPAPHVQPKPL